MTRVMNVENYIRILSKYIADAGRREDVIKEFSDYVEDSIEELCESGMTREKAEEIILRQMGDPIQAGKEMGRIYNRFFDIKMFLCFFALGIGMCVGYYILERFGSEDYIWFQGIPPAFADVAGTGLVLLAFVWSAVEKWENYSLFYAWARNWRGGGMRNSALMFVLGISFLGCYRGVRNMYLMVLFFSTIQLIQRSLIELYRQRKGRELLWETGTAYTTILPYKGKGTVKGKSCSMITREGEQIPKDSEFIVIGISGMKPVVQKL